MKDGSGSPWQVASGHQVTSRTAAELLRAGGNAVDAVVGAAVAACTAEPLLCSLGGGGFALLARPGAAPQLLDFFVQTPRHRHLADLDFHAIEGNFGTDIQQFHIGHAAAATPGMAAGLLALHDRYGRLPRAEVFAPGIAHARDGVTLNDTQAYTLRILAPIAAASPGVRAIYGMDAAGRAPAAGTRLANPDLAASLETLAREGIGPFRHGEIAHRLATTCTDGGGHLGLADPAGYRVRWRRPLSQNLPGGRLWSNPPPAFGGMLVALTLREVLNDWTPELADGGKSWIVRLVGALERTDNLRLELERPELMIRSSDLLAAYRDLARAHPFARRGTTHISVRDREGMMVGMSVSNGEGAGWVIPGTGIHVNNMLGEADTNRLGFNAWPLNVRVASMMAPCLMRHGRDRVMLGSGGSNRIRSAIAQVLLGRLALGRSLEAAVNAARLHVEGAALAWERLDGMPDTASRGWLAGQRPEARVWDGRNLYFGGVHAVSDTGAAADTRRQGVSLSGL